MLDIPARLGLAGAARRRHPPGMPQSRAPVGARDRRARTRSRGLGREPDRSRHARRRRERRGSRRAPARAPLRRFRLARRTPRGIHRRTARRCARSDSIRRSACASTAHGDRSAVRGALAGVSVRANISRFFGIRAARNRGTHDPYQIHGAATAPVVAPGDGARSLRSGARRCRLEPAAARDADRASDVRPPLLHLLDLRRHLRRRLRRDVLFDVPAPEVAGPPVGALPREHDRRDRLDGDPVPDPAVHGVPGDQDHPRDEGHDARPGSRSRSRATSGAGTTTTCRRASASTPTSRRRSRRSRTARPRASTTCSKWTTRWSCRSTPRCAS